MMNTHQDERWFSRGKAEAEKGIPFSERVMGIAIVVFSILMVLYLVAHQVRSTGFFTASFGTSEMLALYGVLILGIISAGLEGVFGLRLHSRLFDVFGGLLLAAVCTTWLLVVFPFEFAYFSDMAPASLSFLVQWISNDIARVLLVLGIIIYLGAAVFCPVAYGFIGKKRSKREENSG
jgi:hypothetical protein